MWWTDLVFYVHIVHQAETTQPSLMSSVQSNIIQNNPDKLQNSFCTKHHFLTKILSFTNPINVQSFLLQGSQPSLKSWKSWFGSFDVWNLAFRLQNFTTITIGWCRVLTNGVIDWWVQWCNVVDISITRVGVGVTIVMLVTLHWSSCSHLVSIYRMSQEKIHQ